MAKSRRVLVVDDDLSVLKMVRTAFEAAGFVVETESDSVVALRSAAEKPPDVIVTDVMMPNLDGWAFARALRMAHETALIPIIFLTALTNPDDRMTGFQLGADDFITKPFSVAELVQRVGNAIDRRARLEKELLRKKQGDWVTEQRRAAVAGSLADIGVPGLLTVLDLERKTGDLVLERASAVARLRLKDGKVFRATLLGGGAIRGVDCVCEVMAWQDGRFEFVPCPVDGPDEIQLTTTALLIEAARRHDEG